MLPLDAVLDYHTLSGVVASGHSRIPVYTIAEIPFAPPEVVRNRKVVGCMLVKSCVLLDPADTTPLAMIPINPVPNVSDDERLTDVLNAFQEGGSHMAIVRRSAPPASTPQDMAEAEVEDRDSALTVVSSFRQRFMRKVADIGRRSSTEPDVERASPTGVVGSSPPPSSIPKRTPVISTMTAEPPQFSLYHPTEPQLDYDFEPLGIITLEDVLEQLIGEEIYDEYDRHQSTSTPRALAFGNLAALNLPSAAQASVKALSHRTSLPSPSVKEVALSPERGGMRHRRVMSDGDAFPALSAIPNPHQSSPKLHASPLLVEALHRRRAHPVTPLSLAPGASALLPSPASAT